MQLPVQVPGSSPYHYYYSVSAESTPSSSTNGGKPPRIDFQFPTSPQPADASGGEEVIIQHYSHPNHPLAQITVPADLFVCGGCKEYGAGKRFICQECDFQLHEFCALSPPALRGHPLHPQHQLVFHSRPKQAGISWPKCDVCGKSIKGFTFRCRACSFQMHPCCAMLSTEMTFPPTPAAQGNDHQHTLKLRCTVCNYHLHAVCAKALINGLRANGMAAPEKPTKSMLGTAARLASQVVIEFIGGLIEGFGEGVGQELVQNITRSRSRRRRRLLQTTTPTT